MKHNGMSRGAKITIVMVIVLLLLTGGVVGGIVLLGNHSKELPDVELSTKLPAPQNLRIDDDWILSFDAVDKAVGYYILIDGQIPVTTNETTLDVSQYATVGSHSFAVRAMHSLASFHSAMSDTKFKSKYLTLSTPTDVVLSEMLFSWGRVAQAKSYKLCVTDDMSGVQYYNISNATTYDLSDYLASKPDLQWFDVSVQASATDLVTGIGNAYLLDSAYSTSVRYYKPNSIDAPRITSHFAETDYIGASRAISWVIKDEVQGISSDYVERFEVWLDGRNICNVEREEFLPLSSYVFDMGRFSATSALGSHEIYILSVPQAGVGSVSLRSNAINYTVRDKLAKVNGSTIVIAKEGVNLIATWQGVAQAASYTIEFQGRMGVEGEYVTFDTVTNITDLRYTLGLAGMQSAFQDVRARVRAVGQGYVDSAEWSGWSAACSTVTKLNTVGDIAVISSDDSVTLSWAGQNRNQMYQQYLGSYYLQVYRIEYEGGAAVQKERVLEFSVDASVETVVISDRLRAVTPATPIPAGKYQTTVIAMPSVSVAQYFAQSDIEVSQVFDYKTRLAAPNSIRASRTYTADGSSEMSLSFVGSVGADHYDVVITNPNIDRIAFSIEQPTDYTSGARVSDGGLLDARLGGMTSPRAYNIAITAVPSESNTGILSSVAAVYTYNDMFKHAAVDGDSITFAQAANSNRLIVTWDAVPTVAANIGYRCYLYTVNGGAATQPQTIDATTTQVDLTNFVTPGVYRFGVMCREISGAYYESDISQSVDYTYNYYILGSADISFEYQAVTQKILVSIPHFDAAVTGYAIQFGDGVPQMMTISEDKTVVTYEATSTELPLYTLTTVKIFAGVSSVSGSDMQKQAYVASVKEMSTQFTNAFAVSELTLSVSETDDVWTLVLDLPTDSVEYTRQVEWEVLLGERSLYREQITAATPLSSHNVRNLNDLIADGGLLSAGEYTIKAVVTSTSGLVSAPVLKNFEVHSGLSQATNFVEGADSAYLQWDAVSGATGYAVSVKKNGTTLTGTIFTFGVYSVADGTGSKDVVRISTVDLFKNNGFGSYQFAIVATSGSTFVANSTAQYTWEMYRHLASPVVEIAKDASGVYAEILTSNYAGGYRVNVAGIGDGGTDWAVTVNNESNLTTLRANLTQIIEAGRYKISVYALPISGGSSDWTESEPTVKYYQNTITADKLSGLSATQAEDGSISLGWTAADYNIWTVSDAGVASSTTLCLNALITVSTLSGEYYADSNGAPIVINLGNSGSATLATGSATDQNSQNINGLLAFMNTRQQGTYLLYFAAQGDGTNFTDSGLVPVRLSFQSSLATPTVSLSETSLVEDGAITLSIADLDQNSNNLIDVEIRDSSSNVVSTLYAKVVTLGSVSGSGTYVLTSDTMGGAAAGDYTLRVRVSQNGVFKASAYTDAKAFVFAKKVGAVTSLAVSKDAGTLTLYATFDTTQLLTASNITVQMAYSGYTYSFVQSGDRYALDYSASTPQNEALRQAWFNASTTALVLNFAITVTPSNMTLPYVAQTTTIAYEVGTVAVPSNVQFTVDTADNSLTIEWDTDVNFRVAGYETTYNMTLFIESNSISHNDITLIATAAGTVATVSKKITNLTTLYNFNSNDAYLFTLRFASIEVKQGSAVVASHTTPSSVYSVYSVDAANTASVLVDYSATSQDYTLTITHDTSNGTVFAGQKYTLLIADNIIAGDITPTAGGTTTVTIDDAATKQKLKHIADQGRQPTFILKVSNAVASGGDSAFVGYKGLDITGTISQMPILIGQAPTVTIDVDTATATWAKIEYVTKYEFLLKDSSGVTKHSATVLAGSAMAVMYDFSAAWADLADGEYTVSVSVLDDASARVYADPSQAPISTVTVTKITAPTTPNSINFATGSNTKGDYMTTITWIYNENTDTNRAYDATRFEVSLTNIATGAVTILDSTRVSVMISGSSTSVYAYTIVLGGRDLTQSGYPIVGGYDPTRTMPVGEYNVGVRLLALEDDPFSIPSGVGYASKKYINKFGVAKVADDAQAFVISPECYFAIDQGKVVSTTEQAEWLAQYEDTYGFNRKYLSISTLGQDLNLATNYRVWVNGIDLGIISKMGSAIDFAAIQSNANKLSLGSIWVPGQNVIRIMPATSAENAAYYLYIDNSTHTEYELTTQQAVNALATTYNVVMYQKYSTPSDPRLNIGYDDVANHNVSRVSLTFGNAAAGYLYSVKMNYRDYYNSGAVESVLLTESVEAAQLTNVAGIGLELYDYLAHLGPHEISFEVTMVGRSGVDGAYYVESKPSTSVWFTYTTSVQEFASKSAASGERQVSKVVEIDYYNQDVTKSYMTNGHLKWDLPVNAYSNQIRYTVTMADENMRNAKPISVILNQTVADNGDRTYALIGNADNLYYIDNDYIYFDMTKYFYNDATVLGTARPADEYYLAGKYHYLIQAEALDRNGAVASGRLFDPIANYGYHEFTFANISYPIAPINVVISSAGLLSWDYASRSEDKYSTVDPVFGIRIITYKADGTRIEPDIIIDNVTNLSMDIEAYLVAGGTERNTVYVYRISPDSFFFDSDLVQAIFASDYASNRVMPSISAEWSGENTIQYSITEDASRLRKIAAELSANDSGAQFIVSVLRVETENSGSLTADMTYDDIVANDSLSCTSYTFAPIDVDVNRFVAGVSELQWQWNLLNQFNLLDEATKSLWVEDGRMIAGRYYAKISLQPTAHQYYNASTATCAHALKEMWRVTNVNDATLTGEFLTTKGRGGIAAPEGNNARDWAETDHKEAIFRFEVNSLADDEGNRHLPTSISVRAKLWNGERYTADRIFTIQYAMPDLNDLLSNPNITTITSEGGDVVVQRAASAGYYLVAIDIHKLFDYTENYASTYAGVYHIEWQIDADEVGSASDAQRSDGSAWYLYTRDVCHYTVIQTPILDYRLDVRQVGSKYAFVVNWALTPNKFSFMINDSADYNINLFAFEQQADGTYLCDTAYDSLDADGKKFFLQNENSYSSAYATSYGFVLEKSITNFGNIYTAADGRRCYVNEPTNVGMELTPNKKYKFFMFCTSKSSSSSNDPNVYYYLSSETSAPQEYQYIEVAPSFSSASITPSQTGHYVVEDESGFDRQKVYYLNASQNNNGYDNAFELFVYDTQDSAAGTNAAWMTNQEEAGTYLAHHIITTLDNETALGTVQPLYVLNNYDPHKATTLDYWRNADGTLRQIGTLKNTLYGSSKVTTIELFDLALDELLSDKTDTPITYYCKIKSWVNNTLVNEYANTDAEGNQIGLTVYGEDWLRRYITTDEDAIANYLTALAPFARELPTLDLNALNPSYYFTFQHTIQFAEPEITEIEIVNNSGATDVVGECNVEFASANSGVTSGYIAADSETNYSIILYLDNVYNADPVFTVDKYIRLNVLAYEYDSEGNIDLTTDATRSFATTLRVHYDGTRSFVVLSNASTESGARQVYLWIDENLPNKIYFNATAVMANPDQNADTSTNIGGENTVNQFILSDGSTYRMERKFAESDVGDTVSIIIKKQYAAPMISLKYDNTVSRNLVSSQYTTQQAGVESNVLSSGYYAGMALNPYLYVDGNSYGIIGAQGGENGYEYQRLSNNADTQYEVVFTYGSRQSSPYLFDTTDINATLAGFTRAVYGETNWSFDYATYQDKYPYAVACLYQKLYTFVNEGVSAGGYHGGVVSMAIRVVAPNDAQEAGYWVSSEFRENSATLSFNVRLETVQTEFDSADATIADADGQRHMATMYAQNGYYYYYQSQIPFQYKTIAKDTAYRVILSRTTGGTTLVYSYDTLAQMSDELNGKEAAHWLPTASAGSWNTGNLATILAQDLFGGNYTDAGYNQWLLGGEWQINIIAYASPSLNEALVTRGFDSNTQTYLPTLQLVNDVNAVSIRMIVNTTTGEVANLSENYQSIISYSSSVTKGGNLALSNAQFTFINTTDSVTKTATINFGNTYDPFPTRYQAVLRDFLNNNYVNNASVIGGKYSYKFKFVVGASTPNAEYLIDSDETALFDFEYYKQLRESDITTSLRATDAGVTFSGSVAKINTITGMNVGLVQRTLNTSGSAFENKIGLTTGSSDTDYTFSGLWSFDRARADCFSTTTYNSTEVTDLTQNGYVSSTNKGYLQAGVNTFRFYPVQSVTDAKYNLLRAGFYVEKTATYIVPESMGASVTLSYDTSSSGGGSYRDRNEYPHSCPTKEQITQTTPNYYDCSACGGDGKLNEYTTEARCTSCTTSPPYAGFGNWVKCSKCNGTDQIITGYKKHSGLGTYDPASGIAYAAPCDYCGGSPVSIERDCPSRPIYGNCTTCHGSSRPGEVWQLCSNCGGDGVYTKKVYDSCTTCGGDGKTDKVETVDGPNACSRCDGTGTYYTYGPWYTVHRAYYPYVTKLKTTLSNMEACTLSAEWSYGWRSGHSGSCTKSAFSKSGETTSQSTLTGGISLSGANYATLTVKIYCKPYFESCFAVPVVTKTLQADRSGEHYETYIT